MAFVAGKNAVFKLDNSSGTITDLSTYITDVSTSLDTATAETTSLGKADATSIVTIGSGSISVTGLFDATTAAQRRPWPAERLPPNATPTARAA